MQAFCRYAAVLLILQAGYSIADSIERWEIGFNADKEQCDDWKIGKDRYEQGKRLQRGGNGTVFKGLDKLKNEEVAIKESLYGVNKASIVEIIALKNIDNQEKRLVVYKGCFMDSISKPSKLITIFGYAKGGSLSDILKMLSENDVLTRRHILKELLLALQVVHDAGYIHRDVKQENFLVKDDGKILIADFGTAVKYDAITCEFGKQVVGTLFYRAPEIAVQGNCEYGKPLDIWAVGVMACDLFESHFSEKIELDRTKDFEFEDKFKSIKDKEPALYEFLASCLQWNPDNRLDISELLKKKLVILEESEAKLATQSIIAIVAKNHEIIEPGDEINALMDDLYSTRSNEVEKDKNDLLIKTRKVLDKLKLLKPSAMLELSKKQAKLQVIFSDLVQTIIADLEYLERNKTDLEFAYQH